MHIPASAFTTCCETAYPANTLFPDVNPISIGFKDMETYMGLVLGLYNISPEGSSTECFFLAMMAALSPTPYAIIICPICTQSCHPR